ncbi:MAG: hypothetical protein CSA66_01815 [Proteobacteria bacterium]|nr:MAG: hypothetical protein CSA66_01815 [Pseudomonadota bacterium]
MPLTATALLLGLALAACRPEPAPAQADATLAKTPAPAGDATPAPALVEAPRREAPPLPDRIDWVVAGGGAWPADNQVSIEDDVAEAVARLGPEGGALLYAGGVNTRGVQVSRDPGDDGGADRLMLLLGDLFDPRAGRYATYRPTRLSPHAAATSQALLTYVGEALAVEGSGPATVYLAGHGEPGQTPATTLFTLWGGDALSPPDLAKALAGAARPARVVVTSCHSGAFADIVFEDADADAGLPAPGDVVHCGLFAATWDRPSSGCDPDPDRRAHEGYGVHFLHALAGQDKLGQPLPLATLDLDGDGAVSLLEAHTRVRVASRGFDVPTTTSERWLRHAAPATPDAPTIAVELPAERAVVAALTADGALPAHRQALRRSVARVGKEIDALDARYRAAAEAEALAVDRVGAEVLGRWPALGDPWHPDFARTLGDERAAIEAFFRTSPRYLDYLDAREQVDEVTRRRDALTLELAPLLRLSRALDNLALAGRLAAAGGPAWRRFEALRACERGPLRPAPPAPREPPEDPR